MSRGYLLDTDVLSATAPRRKGGPRDEAGRAWLRARGDRLYLPSTTVAEVAAGIGGLEASGATRKAQELALWLQDVLTGFADRILGFGIEPALHMRALAASVRGHGVTVGFADLTVGCIATAHDLVVITRNTKHFRPMGVAFLNPFEDDDA